MDTSLADDSQDTERSHHAELDPGLFVLLPQDGDRTNTVTDMDQSGSDRLDESVVSTGYHYILILFDPSSDCWTYRSSMYSGSWV